MKRRIVIIVIDETGPLSVRDDEGDVFAIGAVITDRPEEFGSISHMIRKARGSEEIKYSRNKRIRNAMESSIAATGAEVVGVYVKKDEDVPPWWRIIRRRSWPQRLMMRELSKDLVDMDVDFDKIIIDENTAWKNRSGTNDEGEKIIKRYVGSKRHIGYLAQEDSRAGENKDLVQTADFAIGAMGRILKGRSPETHNKDKNKAPEMKSCGVPAFPSRPTMNSIHKGYKNLSISQKNHIQVDAGAS
jgi:hypothetical protein